MKFIGMTNHPLRINGKPVPTWNVSLVVDDYGNEVFVRLRYKDVCPIYHYLSQTYL